MFGMLLRNEVLKEFRNMLGPKIGRVDPTISIGACIRKKNVEEQRVSAQQMTKQGVHSGNFY